LDLSGVDGACPTYYLSDHQWRRQFPAVSGGYRLTTMIRGRTSMFIMNVELQMTTLHKPQHERFAQFIANGVSLKDAFERAGYVPRRGNPGRLARRPDVARRIAELEAELNPYNAASIDFFRSKLVGIADEIAEADASNVAIFSRAAAGLRELARSFDILAGIDSDQTAQEIPEVTGNNKLALEVSEPA
jgi:hypothetical protein